MSLKKYINIFIVLVPSDIIQCVAFGNSNKKLGPSFCWLFEIASRKSKCRENHESKVAQELESNHANNVVNFVQCNRPLLDIVVLFSDFSTDAVFPHGLSNCSEDADLTKYASQLEDG